MGKLSRDSSKIGRKPKRRRKKEAKSPSQTVLSEHAYCGISPQPEENCNIPSPKTCGFKGNFDNCDCIVHESGAEIIHKRNGHQELKDEADKFYVIIGEEIHKYDEHENVDRFYFILSASFITNTER